MENYPKRDYTHFIILFDIPLLSDQKILLKTTEIVTKLNFANYFLTESILVERDQFLT